MNDVKYLTLQDIADQLGLTYATVRGYNGLAAVRRRRGDVRPGDMPPPDRRFGASPVWLQSTIDGWLQRRPGQGKRAKVEAG